MVGLRQAFANALNDGTRIGKGPFCRQDERTIGERIARACSLKEIVAILRNEYETGFFGSIMQKEPPLGMVAAVLARVWKEDKKGPGYHLAIDKRSVSELIKLAPFVPKAEKETLGEALVLVYRIAKDRREIAESIANGNATGPMGILYGLYIDGGRPEKGLAAMIADCLQYTENKHDLRDVFGVNNPGNNNGKARKIALILDQLGRNMGYEGAKAMLPELDETLQWMKNAVLAGNDRRTLIACAECFDAFGKDSSKVWKAIFLKEAKSNSETDERIVKKAEEMGAAGDADALRLIAIVAPERLENILTKLDSCETREQCIKKLLRCEDITVRERMIKALLNLPMEISWSFDVVARYANWNEIEEFGYKEREYAMKDFTCYILHQDSDVRIMALRYLSGKETVIHDEEYDLVVTEPEVEGCTDQSIRTAFMVVVNQSRIQRKQAEVPPGFVDKAYEMALNGDRTAFMVLAVSDMERLAEVNLERIDGSEELVIERHGPYLLGSSADKFIEDRIIRSILGNRNQRALYVLARHEKDWGNIMRYNVPWFMDRVTDASVPEDILESALGYANAMVKAKQPLPEQVTRRVLAECIEGNTTTKNLAFDIVLNSDMKPTPEVLGSAREEGAKGNVHALRLLALNDQKQFAEVLGMNADDGKTHVGELCGKALLAQENAGKNGKRIANATIDALYGISCTDDGEWALETLMLNVLIAKVLEKAQTYEQDAILLWALNQKSAVKDQVIDHLALTGDASDPVMDAVERIAWERHEIVMQGLANDSGHTPRLTEHAQKHEELDIEYIRILDAVAANRPASLTELMHKQHENSQHGYCKLMLRDRNPDVRKGAIIALAGIKKKWASMVLATDGDWIEIRKHGITTEQAMNKFIGWALDDERIGDGYPAIRGRALGYLKKGANLRGLQKTIFERVVRLAEQGHYSALEVVALKEPDRLPKILDQLEEMDADGWDENGTVGEHAVAMLLKSTNQIIRSNACQEVTAMESAWVVDAIVKRVPLNLWVFRGRTVREAFILSALRSEEPETRTNTMTQLALIRASRLGTAVSEAILEHAINLETDGETALAAITCILHNPGEYDTTDTKLQRKHREDLMELILKGDERAAIAASVLALTSEMTDADVLRTAVNARMAHKGTNPTDVTEDSRIRSAFEEIHKIAPKETETALEIWESEGSVDAGTLLEHLNPNDAVITVQTAASTRN